MKDVSREERWSIELVQAMRLAAQDAVQDAVSHTRSVLSAIESALQAEPGAGTLERLRVRAQNQLESLDDQLTEFRAKAAAISKARRDGAAEEMQWEIPEI
jgi:phage terminase large subunit-like protein